MVRIWWLSRDGYFCGGVRSVVDRQPVLGFEPREGRHLGGAQLFCGLQLVEREVVPGPNLLLDGTLNVGVSEPRIAPARPGQRVLEELKPVFVTGEPRLVKPIDVVVRVMRCTA
jgi:hypothetical protein